jgi:hypothetical protein
VPRALTRLRGYGLSPPHQGMFGKRRLLESVGGFDPRLRYSGDLHQYYELERKFQLSMRLLSSEVAFMRAGGAATAGCGALLSGTLETYRHLRRTHRAGRAATMVLIKTLQTLSELRFGKLADRRWFTQLASE